MGLDTYVIEEMLIAYARQTVGKNSKVFPYSRVCGDLGICDEDMWEMIDYVLDNIGTIKPTAEQPAHININHKEITFSHLADWILNYGDKLR